MANTSEQAIKHVAQKVAVDFATPGEAGKKYYYWYGGKWYTLPDMTPVNFILLQYPGA